MASSRRRGARLSRRARPSALLYLPCISPVSPLYLPWISFDDPRGMRPPLTLSLILTLSLTLTQTLILTLT